MKNILILSISIISFFVTPLVFTQPYDPPVTQKNVVGALSEKAWKLAKSDVHFSDLAGVDESVKELKEIVDFLKNPKKYTEIGARIPKGVLLMGPPGTGKTKLAKAVAGETDRPYYYISGSDFVEMYVGVGAARVRELFAEAKKNAPSIIFIDEIDVIARKRGGGSNSSTTEQEQALNQLLVEMDGFSSNGQVVVIGATNRPSLLDPAIKRSGRFDRHIYVGLPSEQGRLEILTFYAKNLKMTDDVNFEDIARSTMGASGADLENMLNEAALLTVREGKDAVGMEQIIEARDRVLYGHENKQNKISDEEKLHTAYHEAGHTVVSMHLHLVDPVDRVSIVPRGQSLGATYYQPTSQKVAYWKQALQQDLVGLMGGRAAEEIFVGDVSSGAENDLERANNIATDMVTKWGMGNSIGLLNYPLAGTDAGSQETANAVAKEIRKILDDSYAKAKQILLKNRDQVERIAKKLYEKEELSKKEIDALMNPS